MVIATLAIVGVGSLLLSLSTNWIMADTQEELSSQKEIVSNEEKELTEIPIAAVENQNEEKRITEIPIEAAENQNEEVYNQRLQELEIVEEQLEERQRELEVELAATYFVYCGQSVIVKDSLVDKDIAEENGKKIMDFIFDYVDKTILVPYEIDKTAYTYKILRQYQVEDRIHYAVFLLQEDQILCTIGIDLEDETKLVTFARDGLVELYGGSKDIPKEYLIKNWCNTDEKKEEIYNEYYDSSKEIIEEVLGLSPIDEEIKVSGTRYFKADDEWSIVEFGYVLEDGTYVKVFYNRVNQMWDGFVIEENYLE